MKHIYSTTIKNDTTEASCPHQPAFDIISFLATDFL